MPAPAIAAAATILTAVGRFAAPYLAKELGKVGTNKFIQTYGNEAFTSLNQTLAAETPMVNQDNIPMVNPNFMSTGSDDDDSDLPMVRDQQKSNQPQQEPPEDKGPNLGTEVATEAALEISKNLSKEEDIKSQTQKALEPKVEFGPLTETEKQTAQALMGDQPEFYSRVVKSIKDAKPNKLTKNKWKSFIQGDKQELKFLGLDKFLQGNESITKQELLDFIDQTNFANKLSVVEVPLQDQYDFTQYSIGGAGGKRAMFEPDELTPTLRGKEGYKSTTEQYVFKVDGPEQWVADQMHFSKKYATNAIAHARAQTGYFDPDAVEKRLDAKEADGIKLTKDDEILKSASRQLEDTFIIDEIQSDVIQDIQKRGTKEDFIIIKGKDITQDFLQKNYPNYLVKKEPNILPGIGVFSQYGVRDRTTGEIRSGTFESDTGETRKKILEDAQNFATENPNVLYVTDTTTGVTSPEVRLKSNNYYVFKKNELSTRKSFETQDKAQELVDKVGLNPLPITESKKYVELVLNAMIKKAVEKNLDSIGITNGQIQYDRYAGQSDEDKEGLKKFYDEIVLKQLEKVAKKYGVELETVELPGKSEVKDFDDVGLNEPTEESDSVRISRRTSRAIRDGFVLRKVSYSTLANTIENINRGNVEGDPLPENAAIPDFASIFTETGRASGDMILDTLIDDNPDLENEKSYYMWVKPDSNIDKAISRANAGELMSLARAWDTRDINLQMPISAVKEIPEQAYGTGGDYTDYFSMVAEGTPNESTSVAQYNYYIKNYFKDKEKFDIKYLHKIIKMKLPKKLQKDILSKPIKLSKAKQQTDRLFA